MSDLLAVLIGMGGPPEHPLLIEARDFLAGSLDLTAEDDPLLGGTRLHDPERNTAP